MPRKPTAQQLYDELTERYGREIAAAFEQAIDDLRSAADLQRAQAAIEAGDLNALVQALHLDPAAYSPVLDAVQRAYGAGGQVTASSLPKLKDATLFVRFNARNPAAERWLKDHASEWVTRTLDDQKAAIRQRLETGLQRGENPRTTALDIVGRLNRATGKREGGVIGLTAQQEQYLESARQELAGGDLRNYLTRARRDRRFDRAVKKALETGDPIPADLQRKAVQQYSNRLLKLRGDVIGQHETFTALAASKHEAYRQAIENGAVSPSAVKKKWKHLPSEHPRLQHVAMQGKTVGFSEPFILPDGTRMLYPHDPSAPIRHTAGCHCQADYVVDFLAGLT